ncbi:MAG: hypothetical protein IK077_01485 [Thermoguttaceae bacterium]|nr:hypothetical protein [Thermoguttaceae bacterium]
MKRVLIAVVILLESLTGCSDPSKHPERLRDELQPFCRENDAIVLASSRYLPEGKIYYFEKQNGQWRKSQIIDLTPYLKDGFSKQYTLHLDGIDRLHGCFAKNWLAYNDRWLVLTIRKTSAENFNGNMRDYRGKAIIFKKVDGRWSYYYSLDSKESFVCATCVGLTDSDQLLVSDPCEKKGVAIGVVKCFDLTGDKPRLFQKINLNDCNCSEDEKSSMFGDRFFVARDLLFVRRTQKVPGAKLGCTVDYLLYRSNNDHWEYVCSFRKLIPQNLCNDGRNYPLVDVNNVFFHENRIMFQHTVFGHGGLLFRLNDEGCEYNQGLLVHANLSEDLPCIQKPFVYTLEWRGKRERFALVKPSPDETFRVVEPDWIVEDADPRTNQLISDYYRYDYTVDYVRKIGYKSYYEFVDWIPTVDYSLSGRTLVTSYNFDICYYRNNPMQKAEVWGGVNIYEIDPEKGPIKKFALTTRNLEELKEVPLNTETPEEEKPFDSKILDKYFK